MGRIRKELGAEEKRMNDEFSLRYCEKTKQMFCLVRQDLRMVHLMKNM